MRIFPAEQRLKLRIELAGRLLEREHVENHPQHLPHVVILENQVVPERLHRIVIRQPVVDHRVQNLILDERAPGLDKSRHMRALALVFRRCHAIEKLLDLVHRFGRDIRDAGEHHAERDLIFHLRCNFVRHNILHGFDSLDEFATLVVLDRSLVVLAGAVTHGADTVAVIVCMDEPADLDHHVVVVGMFHGNTPLLFGLQYQ